MVYLVLSSCPDLEVARKLGREMVELQLAACATCLPGATSIYRWEGELRQDPECLLLLKTGESSLSALLEGLAASHPYEVPEILAFEAGAGLPAYLQWVEDSARRPD